MILFSPILIVNLNKGHTSKHLINEWLVVLILGSNIESISMKLLKPKFVAISKMESF